MKKSLLLLGFVVAFAAQAETVVIEAESFDDWGGWVNDTQFMDQMGSPYLLAHGLGKSVADAKTKFVVAGGRYNVWVRTKNWTSFWHPGWRLHPGAGTFNIVVNGEKLPNVIGGQGSGEWEWVKAGEVTLKVGENTVALHDLDGFDGRVDAIVFSTKGSSEFTPRDSLLRESVGKTMPPYDVVVVGGGIAGICAAISSARLGLKTRSSTTGLSLAATTRPRCASILAHTRTSLHIRGLATWLRKSDRRRVATRARRRFTKMTAR